MSATSTPVAVARPAAPRRLRVAGFWRRTAAALIDLAVVLPALFLVRLILQALAPADIPPLSDPGITIAIERYLEGSPAFIAWVLLSAGIALLYHTLFWGLNGRTLGLRAMGARVVDVYGDTPSLARAALRSFGFVLGALVLVWAVVRVMSPEHTMVAPFAATVLALLGWLWAGIDRDKRGLHDWLAGTYVVRT